MARKIVFTCDVCGAEKKETNNWFDVFVQLDAENVEHMEIHHFDLEAEDQHFTVCGERCAIRLLSRWMQTGSLEDTPIEAVEEDDAILELDLSSGLKH